MSMDQELKLREQLSALADGQLPAGELPPVLDYAGQAAGRQAWLEYQLIGDALRSAELARASAAPAFLAGLHERLAQEPAAPRPAPHAEPQAPGAGGLARGEAANQALFRWKMMAGIASLAAVSALGWNVLDAVRGPATGAQLAAAPARGDTASVQVAAQPAADSQVMLRDPRLDELLAARRQYSGANALQMPARFLRNTTLEEPQR